MSLASGLFSESPAQAEINRRLLSSDHLQEGLGRRTMRGGAIATGSQVVRLVLQIFATAVLARLLIPEDFGLVAMGGTVMAFIAVFTETSVSTATIQRDDLDQDTASAILLINLAMGVFTVLISALAAPLAVMVFGDERLPWIVVGLALTIPIQALGSQHYALLNRNMKWIDSHLASLGAFFFGIVAGITSAWIFDVGYWALVVQAWATAIAGAAIAWMRCAWRPSWVHDWSGAKASLKFGLNLTGAMVMNYFHRQLDNVLIGWRWGAVELGYYSRAYNLLLTPLNFIQGPIGQAMIPALSRLQTDPARWRNGYLDALGLVSVLGAGMAALLYGGSEPIIDLVFGPGWEKSEEIFSYLVISMLAATPMATSGWIYISLGRTRRMLYWSMIGPPLYAIAFLIGLPYGATGLAFCYAIAQLVAFLPCMWMATRDTNVTLLDVLAFVLPPTAAAVVVGAGLRYATAHLGPIEDFIAICAAGLVFIALVAPAVWLMPTHRRLRDLGLKAFNLSRARLAALRTQSP